MVRINVYRRAKAPTQEMDNPSRQNLIQAYSQSYPTGIWTMPVLQSKAHQALLSLCNSSQVGRKVGFS